MQAKDSLRRSAVLLALAGGVEFGLQLAMPMILVRYLDKPTFAQYRMLWLMASTALAIAPAFMPQSLFYFLPRSEPGQRRAYVRNTLLYLALAGGVAVLFGSGWNPLLPPTAVRLVSDSHGLSAVFLGLWVMASMLDLLPTADGNARGQARATVAIACTRALLLGVAALASGDIGWVVRAMLGVAVFKIALLTLYTQGLWRRDGGAGGGWRGPALKTQLAYALPFALGNGLFLLRVQADEWVVAGMLAPALYAVFSVAGVVLPIASLIRQPVNNAMMPHLNDAHARGDLREIARLISKSNGATALLLIPVVGGLLVVAPELVRIIYTSRYQEAAPVMQVYLVGMVFNAFAVGHVLSALGKGRFAMLNSAVCLALSIVFSIVGVRYFGMVGAALGSIMTLAIGEIWALRVVAEELGLSIRELLAWGALLPTVFGTLVGIGGADLLAGMVDLNVFGRLLFKGSIYLALFVPLFLLVGGMKQLTLLIGLPRWRSGPAQGGA